MPARPTGQFRYLAGVYLLRYAQRRLGGRLGVACRTPIRSAPSWHWPGGTAVSTQDTFDCACDQTRRSCPADGASGEVHRPQRVIGGKSSSGWNAAPLPNSLTCLRGFHDTANVRRQLWPDVRRSEKPAASSRSLLGFAGGAAKIAPPAPASCLSLTSARGANRPAPGSRSASPRPRTAAPPCRSARAAACRGSPRPGRGRAPCRPAI
jgi:hypothetical protein